MAKLVFSHFNIRCFSRRGSCVSLKRATTECQSEIKGKTTSVTSATSPFSIFFYCPAGQQGENRTTLVFFLGGVSYAEIAALRFLSQMEDSGMEYIIATTKLMNGTTWIKSLMDRPESQTP